MLDNESQRFQVIFSHPSMNFMSKEKKSEKEEFLDNLNIEGIFENLNIPMGSKEIEAVKKGLDKNCVNEDEFYYDQTYDDQVYDIRDLNYNMEFLVLLCFLLFDGEKEFRIRVNIVDRRDLEEKRIKLNRLLSRCSSIKKPKQRYKRFQDRVNTFIEQTRTGKVSIDFMAINTTKDTYGIKHDFVFFGRGLKYSLEEGVCRNRYLATRFNKTPLDFIMEHVAQKKFEEDILKTFRYSADQGIVNG